MGQTHPWHENPDVTLEGACAMGTAGRPDAWLAAPEGTREVRPYRSSTSGGTETVRARHREGARPAGGGGRDLGLGRGARPFPRLTSSEGWISVPRSTLHMPA